MGRSMTKDRGGGKTTFEFIKSFLSRRQPFEALGFAEERRDWGGDVGITVDESTVKVGNAEEDLNIVDGGWGWPFRDCSNTIGVHGDTVEGNDEAEERRGRGVEFAFAKFAGQAVLTESG
jgi:hypothetical protein